MRSAPAGPSRAVLVSGMADELPSLTIEILKQIRDGISGLGTRLDETNRRLDETNTRLSSVETGLKDLRVAVLRVAKVNDAVLDEQIKDTDKIEGLEVRVQRLEQHAGLPPLR